MLNLYTKVVDNGVLFSYGRFLQFLNYWFNVYEKEKGQCCCHE